MTKRTWQILVVAGVIRRDGQILICQRRKGDRHEFKWEFPGGKVEPRESPKRALARELREELGIKAVIGPEILRYEHTYPQGTAILLMFYEVLEFEGEPQNFAFHTMRWESPRNLTNYEFLDGDVDFVCRLATGEIT